ncbi:MAG: hypothetical protein UY70_C0009G0015 [Candidatus Kaiserbacteria bacterium GW2011_GWB1_52_6]|uniref:Uncharacterized protein n=3 Tax=Candidatus Kaiseribacteriota TaxID=1752734 RepID=A0A0G1XKS1_9BACT|nr:MAG: hypothetical protein UY67_C0012G0014 [Candidatus Kaiserbacteria bacterium GW2011_GWA2_52_12]KKW27689.1 MAG: hypothetical protein UY70_C0009G0015 [Candidatus Kaiserbacteria bacterium GW2011_GWB1_52_6]KKW31475.1 MAG: hypothetical protein UY74_C0013G0014 [Candidatus Kaiserbacteria bacterium GW2011_GWC2_52_8b]
MISQKIVTHSFIALNITIIIAAEFIGGGTFFFENGIIHGIAALFIIGVAISLLHRYYFADPMLKKFLNACLIAFGVFSFSHVVEFLSDRFLGGYGDYLFALTLNFYIISLLIMITGSETFLRAYSGYQRSRTAFALSNSVILAFAVFSGLLFFDTSLISLEPANVVPYLYVCAVLTVAFVFWRRIIHLRRTIPLLDDFFVLLLWMVVFIAISASAYALYDVIKDVFSISEHQIVYLSHFLFYGGMSIMFIAFHKLSYVGGGVIDDIKNYKKRGAV